MLRIAIVFAPEDAAAIGRIEAWAALNGFETDKIEADQPTPEITALRRRIVAVSSVIMIVTPHWAKCPSCRVAFREARLLRRPTFPIIVGSGGELVIGSDISRVNLSETEVTGLSDLAEALDAEVQMAGRIGASGGHYRFKAFLSYSHHDKRQARWLHTALEGYRLPRQLAGRRTEFGEVRRRLGKAFRDDEELKGSADLAALIQGALEESETLVVICSPRSARSMYVDQEIANFKRLGRESRIVPVIIDGKPHDPETECFPPTLKRKAGLDGRITDELAEPIAVDVREHGRRKTLLKVVAGITGLDFDELEQRDRRRRRQQRRLVAGAVIIVLMGLGVTAMILDQAEAQRTTVAEAAQILLEREPVQSARLALAAMPSDSDLVPLGREAAAILRDTGYAYETRHLDPEKRYLAFAYSDDGQRLVSADGNDEVVVWDTSSLQPLKVLDFSYYGGPTSFRDIYLAPGGSRLVTSPSEEGPAQLWDLRTGAWIASLGPDSERVLTLKFARDGQSVVVIYQNAPAGLFNLEDGKEIATFEIGSYAIDLSADGTRLLMQRSNNGPTKLWDARTGRLIAELQAGRDSTHARFTPDGSLVVTATSELGAILWKARDGSLLARMGGPGGAERSVISADGLRLATVGSNGVAALWDLSDGHRIATIGEPRTQEVEFADGFGKVITKTAELQAFISDTATGSAIGRIGEPGEGYRVYFSASGRRVVLATRSFSAVVRDFGTGELVARLGGVNDAHVLKVSKDHLRVETADFNHWVRQWEMETGEPIGAIAGPNEGNNWTVDNDRRLAVVLSAFGEALVRRIDTKLNVNPQVLLTQTCAMNREVIGAFRPAERDSNHPWSKWLLGRPWHPCDWRGLRTLEGWAQMARYWAVRAGLPLDYKREENTALGKWLDRAGNTRARASEP